MMTNKKKVLVTGLAGRIGKIIRINLSEQFEISALDRMEVEGYTTVVANISDFEAIRPAFDGIDVVVHLAADPDKDGTWETTLENNIIGTRNVYEASRIAGVKRVVFASSNHAVGFYPLKDTPYKQIYDGDFSNIRQPIQPLATHLVRPDGYYGVSKSFGESLGSYFHDEYGLSVICMRIGWVLGKLSSEHGDSKDDLSMDDDDPTFAPSALSLWMSHRDTAQFVEKCVNAPESVGFAIFYGMSGNTYGIWDMESSFRVIGYNPLDDAGTFWEQVDGKPHKMTSGDPQS